MKTLEGKVAVVTGASRGIGAAIAQRLASQGASIAAVARTLDAHPTLPGTLRDTVAAVEQLGARAIAVPADLSEPADRARAIDEARAALGAIDILVNNGAAAFYIPFDKVSEKRFRIAFEVNVRAPWDLAQRVVPDMIERGGGSIVNISSAGAKHAEGPPFEPHHQFGGHTLYGATKAALDRISTGLAAELHAHAIRVNSLAPVAAVMTPGVEALGVVPEEYRASAEPIEALAEATLALCEESGAAITGKVLASLPFLEEIGRPIRTLDGTSLIEPNR